MARSPGRAHANRLITLNFETTYTFGKQRVKSASGIRIPTVHLCKFVNGTNIAYFCRLAESDQS